MCPGGGGNRTGWSGCSGTPALFATAYGNVGSSIYYALGVTAAISLGLTPLVFVVSGLIFACTAATYAEGTVLFPEAGGSSSFARHAFNELVSFGAAWAQMLNYVITVAISAFFVPHYLSIFWAPLKTNPWDVIGGIVVVIVLVGINIVGVKEAAALNVVLAVVDFATQLLLVVLGFVLIFSPHVLKANIHFGTAPTWSNFALAIPVAMIAYTGIETVSNLAEEARDPRRTIPASIRLVAIAVFAIYFTLPLVALSALPVHQDAAGQYVTRLGQDPPHGFKNDPVLGLVENLHLHGFVLSAAKIYVGVLAATILFIATNAGVIGASRITYSMSTHRQLPEVFRRLHPKFKTPWLSLLVFAGVFSILFMLPGQRRLHRPDVRVRGDALVHDRPRRRDPAAPQAAAGRDALPRQAEPQDARSQLAALRGASAGSAPGLAWLVVVVQDAPTRYAGLAWLAAGFVFYFVYRRRLGMPLRARRCSPRCSSGPRSRSSTGRSSCRSCPAANRTSPIDLAARLAAERGATIVALRVIVVPLDVPARRRPRGRGSEGRRAPRRGARRGRHLRACGRSTASAAPATPAGRSSRRRPAASQRSSSSARREGATATLFGKTVDYVLKNAPCRVMVAAGKKAGMKVHRAASPCCSRS